MEIQTDRYYHFCFHPKEIDVRVISVLNGRVTLGWEVGGKLVFGACTTEEFQRDFTPVPITEKGKDMTDRRQAITAWMEISHEAMAALVAWKLCLRRWLAQPPTDKEFMRAIQGMSRAGLMEFLDGCTPRGCSIDEFREAVTRNEAKE